jgi:N-acetylglucosaminyl-diphospho-decaprenol L-rhamnosyltransferase
MLTAFTMDAVTVTADSGADLKQMLACEPLLRSFDRLIVVDNMSGDGSPEMARRVGAIVISRDRREGYGSCVNIGARHATGSSFAVLNPDIRFDDDQVVPRLERQLRQPGVGLVAPELVLPSGRVQDSARQVPTPLDLLLRRGIDPERGAIHVTGEVPWVVGACFIVRRDAWDTVGGFDERYFLYFEDVDLCWRLRQAGWMTRLECAVHVRHQHSAASRNSILGWATRKHLASAALFYRSNPRFIVSNKLTRS